MNHDLCIFVFACATIPKYKADIIKIEETWGLRAKQLGVKVLYMLGQEPTDLIGDQYIYLEGVGNDYLSASTKQNLGLKYIHDHVHVNFTYSCGSDTYVNVDKLLHLLANYDPNEPLYLGGHGEYRQIGPDVVYFHSGGGGFVVSKSMVERLYDSLDDLLIQWTQVCQDQHVEYLIPACDVCIAYYIHLFKGHCIMLWGAFLGCNHLGDPCCVGHVRMSQMITCHRMTLPDFDYLSKFYREVDYLRDQPIYPHRELPNCTMIFACYSVDSAQKVSSCVTLPCYQIYYGTRETLRLIANMRWSNGYQALTIFYELETSDLSFLSFLSLLKRTIQNNPFGTDRFLWVNHENPLMTAENLVPIIHHQETKNLRLYVTQIIPESSHMIYQVSTDLIMCNQGSSLLLSQIFRNPTKGISSYDVNESDMTSDSVVLGSGHVEHMIKNFLGSKCDAQYIEEQILTPLQNRSIHRVVSQLACDLITSIDQGELVVKENIHIRILFRYYVSAYYYQPSVAKTLANSILGLCEENPEFKRIFHSIPYYADQLAYLKYI